MTFSMRCGKRPPAATWPSSTVAAIWHCCQAFSCASDWCGLRIGWPGGGGGDPGRMLKNCGRSMIITWVNADAVPWGGPICGPPVMPPHPGHNGSGTHDGLTIGVPYVVSVKLLSQCQNRNERVPVQRRIVVG